MSEGHDDLPDDMLHTHVYLFLGGTFCCGCNVVPDILSIWEEFPADASEASAREFTRRAVPRLRQLGWQVLDDLVFCPECAAKQPK